MTDIYTFLVFNALFLGSMIGYIFYINGVIKKMKKQNEELETIEYD